MGKTIYHAADDARWNHPVIDRDEPAVRKLMDGTEIAYRYLHGFFDGTDVKFSFCLPPQEVFAGRFFHLLSPFPGPDEEMASLQLTGEDDWVGFALLHNTAFVESNMGSAAAFGAKKDDTLVWQSSAAVAEYFRVKCMELYGCPRPFGIVFGGSGGGYKTMACIENTDAWDGGVPFVIGSPVSLPNTICMHAQGQRVLRNCFGKIVDALDAGGSGDMYAGLNADEAAILKELTAMGFPPRSWFPEAWGYVDDGSLPVLTPGVKMADPTFFTEFWTVPGYEGADPDSSACRDRLVFTSPVKRVVVPQKEDVEGGFDARNDVDNAWQKMLTDASDVLIELEELPEGDDLYLKGVNITFESGAAVGKTLSLGGMVRNPQGKGGAITLGMIYGVDDVHEILDLIQPGDLLHLDNSDYIAIQSYYRHQVPADLSFHAWDQFRNEDGTPAIPQRAFVMGYGFTGTGTVQDGNIQCPAIVVQSLMDESTVPWCADWYRQQVIASKGSEDTFRVYYNDRCFHGPVAILENNMITNYGGILRQALLDMAAWLQDGKEPLPSTVYENKDNQIYVPDNAADRRGMQPTIVFTAAPTAEGDTNRAPAEATDCVRIKAGESVTLYVDATVPEGAGSVTAVDYDFEDRRTFTREGTPVVYTTPGTFEAVQKGSCNGAYAAVSHVYTEPGTHFASVRVKAERNGDPKAFYTETRNVARVRIIVE